MFITQIHDFRNFKNRHDLYISKSQHSLVWKNYNVVVFHISDKNNGWDSCAGFTKLTTDLRNTPLIHNTLLVLHPIFCWYADPPSTDLYLQFSYSLFWFCFVLVCANQIFMYTQENQLDKLVLASNKEQLAILLHLAKLSRTGKNILIFSHNNTSGS